MTQYPDPSGKVPHFSVVCHAQAVKAAKAQTAPIFFKSMPTPQKNKAPREAGFLVVAVGVGSVGVGVPGSLAVGVGVGLGSSIGLGVGVGEGIAPPSGRVLASKSARWRGVRAWCWLPHSGQYR